jgi:hypothetical protein
MNNQVFISANSMPKVQTLKEYYVYYIESFKTKINNLNLTHFYVADRKIVLDIYTKVIVHTNTYLIFQFDYRDGVPRKLKGFITKEYAQLEIDRMEK